MLTLNDGRSELFQWDTGRKLTVDAECSQVHFSNKVFGRSIDVDVVYGVAIIPDTLLQTDKELTAWAFVGTPENGYTKISKVFKVNRRNKPADYVFTPTEQTTLSELVERLDAIEESQDPDAIKNAVDDYLQNNPIELPVTSVNNKTGDVELNADDVGAISQEDLQAATDSVLAQAKESGLFDGADGAPGKAGADGQDGKPGRDGVDGQDGIGIQSVEQTTTSTEDGGTNVVTVTKTDGTSSTFSVKNGSRGNTGPAGAPGAAGADGYTPVKGTDYFTESDKAELVEAVMAALPAAEEASF